MKRERPETLGVARITKQSLIVFLVVLSVFAFSCLPASAASQSGWSQSAIADYDAKYDKDGDGTLSPTERAEMMEIKPWDTNGNGQIDGDVDDVTSEAYLKDKEYSKAADSGEVNKESAINTGRFWIKSAMTIIGVSILLGTVLILSVYVFDYSNDGTFDLLSKVTFGKMSFFEKSLKEVLVSCTMVLVVAFLFMNGTILEIVKGLMIWVTETLRLK